MSEKKKINTLKDQQKMSQVKDTRHSKMSTITRRLHKWTLTKMMLPSLYELDLSGDNPLNHSFIIQQTLLWPLNPLMSEWCLSESRSLPDRVISRYITFLLLKHIGPGLLLRKSATEKLPNYFLLPIFLSITQQSLSSFITRNYVFLLMWLFFRRKIDRKSYSILLETEEGDDGDEKTTIKKGE